MHVLIIYYFTGFHYFRHSVPCKIPCTDKIRKKDVKKSQASHKGKKRKFAFTPVKSNILSHCSFRTPKRPKQVTVL